MGLVTSKLFSKGTKSKFSTAKLRKFGFKRKKKVQRNSSILKSLEATAVNAISSDSNDDNEAKKRMQSQLAFDSDIFVLNQMMMSVQFFGNFERDLREAIELNSRKENQKTRCLTRHCKAVMFPDRLAEAVDRRVKYVEKHGKMKNQLQALHTQALYIVYENIEIINSGDTSMYSMADNAPLYKFQVDDPYEGSRRKKVIHHAGYIKLKSSDKISRNDNLIYNSSSDSQYVSGSMKNETEDDGMYGDNEEEFDDDQKFDMAKNRVRLAYARNVNNIFEQKIGFFSASMNSLTPSSSEYDYTYIKDLHTPKPLTIVLENENELSTVVLPDTCLTTVSRFMIHNSQQNQFYRYSTEDDEVFGSDEKLKNSCYEDRQYLNSKVFLSNFIQVFQQILAKEIGISDNVLNNATWMGSSVYCEPYEVIPAISCPWPREANEWIYRKREIRIDSTTNQPFQWPSLEMIEKITNFGCHVIPQGFAPKTGSNAQRELEWKIVFPEAQRFIESRLTFGQIKIYMITRALFKAFIEPTIEQGLFNTDHIRNHLYWQCEFNYTAWNEELLGEGLLKFLNSLLQCFKTHRLPDYFIPKRNLLENIPEKILVGLHKKIYRIVENPVPYVMIAVRNLRSQRDFYPKLKYKRLYSRLLIDDPTKILNPQHQTVVNDFMAPQSDEEAEASLGSIAYYDRKERKSRRRRKRRVRFALDDHYVAAYSRKKEVNKIARKFSTESIDTKVVFLKHMEVLRRKLIYDLFIEQFIEMTKLSLKKYHDNQQSLFFLRQAERLCHLLADDKFHQDAQKFLKTIDELKEIVRKSKRDNLQGPELPRRTSLAQNMRDSHCDITINNNEEEIPSDDDNDEIYSYHKSVTAQIHATSAEKLARFLHTDDDEIESIVKPFEKINVSMESVDAATAL